jgi:hypothetical protein
MLTPRVADADQHALGAPIWESTSKPEGLGLNGFRTSGC